MSVIAACALVVTSFWALSTAAERNYLSEISDLKLSAEFANETVAVLQGKAYCAELQSGQDPIGYRRQQLAVKHFCSEFLQGFEVIPTPQEQQRSLLTQFRKAGFAGRFSSDAEAVSYAKGICTKLEGGAKPKGIEADFIAVTIYCKDFKPGFRILDEIKVKATFQIDGDRYGWFPSIGGPANSCYGRGGYNDIGSSTSFNITNPAGEVLAEGDLGKGKGGGSVCKFTFEFTVLEGEDKYYLEIGRRGKVKFSEAQLKIPGRVKLFL
jgi:hypothetical protein